MDLDIIVWCETKEDLIIAEKLTEIYFTEEKNSNIVDFPCIFFREDMEDTAEYDYDLYEYNPKAYRSIKEFKEKFNYEAKKRNLKKTSIKKLKRKYPEYLI